MENVRAVRQQSELAVLDLRFKYLLTDDFISLFVPFHHSHMTKSRAEGSTGSCCHESGLAAAWCPEPSARSWRQRQGLNPIPSLPVLMVRMSQKCSSPPNFGRRVRFQGFLPLLDSDLQVSPRPHWWKQPRWQYLKRRAVLRSTHWSFTCN